mmetsp:Transcript_57998/g.86157  ORF Transcript_57998/g.86157 Transcript_57998/m.86157 type:complete len:501 (-) Transcript_57998:343-1845(-)
MNIQIRSSTTLPLLLHLQNVKGALVYFMQAGFAMLCAGSIRTKNVMNVLLWNLLDSCGGAIGFWSIGYAFAYGGDDMGGKTFIGHANFFLMDGADMEDWFFQFAFACALSSIVAGTVAERSKMQAYLCYSLFLTGFVYPVVAHAFWSTNGWLSNSASNPLWGSGVIDLAGSGPVHMTGGVTALVMALVLGPRIGRFHDSDGNLLDVPREFPPHSVALQFLGTFCLWFGWYGFNPGSTLNISSEKLGDVASLAAVNTTLGAAAGAVSALFTKSIRETRRTGVTTYDLTAAMNGCLTGLVAITAPCATVEPWAGFVIGIIAGWLYLLGSHLLVMYRIDDAVDAIPVHMVGGAWGVISAGLFTNESRLEAAFGMTENIGWFYEWGRGSGNFTLLGIQLIAVLFILAWVFAIMGPFFIILNYYNWLRVDPLEEEVGLDISRHNGSVYNYEEGTAKVESIDSLHKRRSIRGSHSGRSKSGKITQINDTFPDEPIANIESGVGVQE